jgi:molybdopterin molybdotransferase
MISVAQARTILNDQPFEKRIVQKDLPGAIGFVLAEDIYAPLDIPAFDQSSMDGYAFAFNDWAPGKLLKVAIEIPAGRNDDLSIQKEEAARVFTGAPIPDGADTVVMQEQVSAANGQLNILQKDLKKGNAFRARGSEIKKGELALTKGTEITTGTIGFLAGLGFNEVKVFAAPSVSIIITGNELQQPGQALQHGQVYEASSYMLTANLRQMGIPEIAVLNAKDELEETVAILKKALGSSDVVLLTGGVSVGEYDFVVEATKRCNVQQLFHKVKQRPGKPLFAGRTGNRMVFGLPGNPSSVLTCFYQYVWPLLRKWTGHGGELKKIQVPLARLHDKQNQMTHFLKGIYKDGKVEVLPAQDSYRMRSFAVANCLVELDEPMRTYDENELVTIQLLPTYG